MSTAVSVITLFASFGALILSIYTFRVQRLENSYSDIDDQYRNLLQLALQDAELRNYEKTSRFYKLSSRDPFRSKYDIYAYMCWNLVETIYDRQKDKKGRFSISATWVPVLIEENRLHYTWFKHNLRLFKPEFQKFVSTDLNDIVVSDGRIDDLDAVYEKMEQDFPSDERLARNRIELLMAKGHYHLLIARHRLFDVMIGYAFVFEPEHPKITWLDYMVIDEKFQNVGYGTLLFNKLSEHRKGDNLGVFLEVEIPGSDDEGVKKDQNRRIAFYERLGAKRLGADYELPTNEDSLPMHLYFRPSPGVHLLPKDQIQEAIASAFTYIHGDKIHRERVLKRFVQSVHDETF